MKGLEWMSAAEVIVGSYQYEVQGGFRGRGTGHHQDEKTTSKNLRFDQTNTLVRS